MIQQLGSRRREFLDFSQHRILAGHLYDQFNVREGKDFRDIASSPDTMLSGADHARRVRTEVHYADHFQGKLPKERLMRQFEYLLAAMASANDYGPHTTSSVECIRLWTFIYKTGCWI